MVHRVLSIVVLLLLLATGMSVGGENGACHEITTHTASEPADDLPSAVATSLTSHQTWADVQTISSGHCLTEFLEITAHVIAPALDVRSFHVAVVPLARGLMVPPEPQPPRN